MTSEAKPAATTIALPSRQDWSLIGPSPSPHNVARIAPHGRPFPVKKVCHGRANLPSRDRGQA
jgi:hypothetical protein